MLPLKLKETQADVLVSSGESKKKESVDSELTYGRVNKVLLMGSNKESSMGACKSYCMNFDSFKIMDSSLP